MNDTPSASPTTLRDMKAVIRARAIATRNAPDAPPQETGSPQEAAPPQEAPPAEAPAPKPPVQEALAKAPRAPFRAPKRVAREGLREKAPRKPKPVTRTTLPKIPKPARPALRAAQATWRERLRESLHGGVAYSVAGLLHMVVLVVLSFFTILTYVQKPAPEVSVRFVPSAEVVLPEHQDMQLEALTEADLPELPEVDAQQDFDQPLGDTTGSLGEAVSAFGLSRGGGGRGRGGSQNTPGGASQASDGSVNEGLEWLIRHRTRSGVWGAVHHHDADDPHPASRGDAARTGLALLCFMAAGHGPEEEGPYQSAVRGARDWLAERVRDSGQVSYHGNPWAHNYVQAIATLALAESLHHEDVPAVRTVVTNMAQYLGSVRGPEGWRYQARSGSDTSVTGWVLLALKAAEQVGVPVDPTNFEVGRAWMEAVTEPGGQASYLERGTNTYSMTATSLFVRILLGEPARSERNQRAARLLAVRARSAVSRTEIHDNLYELYYSALGMYQIGGEVWESYNPTVRDGIVQAQVDAPGGCEHGAWRTGGHLDDWVLSTAFGILILETYYRYTPSFQRAVSRAEPTEGELAFDRALTAVRRARREPEGATLLAAEVAVGEGLDALGDEAPGLASQLRLLAVELAAMAEHAELTVERIDAYLERLPEGDVPDPSVFRLRRWVRLRSLSEEAQAFLAREDWSEPERADLQDRLRVFEARLIREAAQLEDPEARADVVEDLALVRDLDARLTFLQDLDAALAEAEAGLDEAEGPVGTLEMRYFAGLLQRATGHYRRAAAEVDAASYHLGEADMVALERRGADARLSDDQAERLAALGRLAQLARAAADVALERPEEALLALDFAVRGWPEGAERPEVVLLERAALILLEEQGRARPEDVERLRVLLVRWASEEGVATQVVYSIAVRLERLGAEEDAAGVLRRLTGEGGELGLQVRVRLARLRRLAGEPEEALAALEREPRGMRDRVAWRLELARCKQAVGEAREALERYGVLLRALDDRPRPELWWEVLEDMLRTYGDLGEVREARDLMQQVRRQDPTFGGDPERQRRLVDLMQSLDRL